MRSTRLFGVALTLAAAYLVAAAVDGRAATPLARAHQLRPSSLAAWLLTAPLPKMYAFAHRVIVRQGAPAVGDGDGAEVWVNHAPARYLRVDEARERMVRERAELSVVLETSYRGRRWSSRWRVTPHDDAIELTLVDEQP